ncbi:MAG: hypothetical protein AAF623_09615, partial [Planctomycetota bacterium]
VCESTEDAIFILRRTYGFESCGMKGLPRAKNWDSPAPRSATLHDNQSAFLSFVIRPERLKQGL